MLWGGWDVQEKSDSKSYLTSLGALETAKPTNAVDCNWNQRSLQSNFQMGVTTQYQFEDAYHLVSERGITYLRVKS